MVDPRLSPAAFYFDLASPEAYLSAERILALLPVVAEWMPVRIPPAAVDTAAVERRVAERGLQPVRWPARLPFDSSYAMRAATYAKGGGKTVQFAQAAFRQAYAGGRDLSVPEHVLIAAAACEIHPRALTTAVGSKGVARRLEEATALAHERGVRSTPALWTGSEVVHGDDALDAAAASATPER